MHPNSQQIVLEVTRILILITLYMYNVHQLLDSLIDTDRGYEEIFGMKLHHNRLFSPKRKKKTLLWNYNLKLF